MGDPQRRQPPPRRRCQRAKTRRKPRYVNFYANIPDYASLIRDEIKGTLTTENENSTQQLSCNSFRKPRAFEILEVGRLGSLEISSKKAHWPLKGGIPTDEMVLKPTIDELYRIVLSNILHQSKLTALLCSVKPTSFEPLLTSFSKISVN